MRSELGWGPVIDLVRNEVALLDIGVAPGRELCRLRSKLQGLTHYLKRR